MTTPGSFDARYVAFLETISTLRPRLHRYCSRMTGSSLDGEDVVQDALFAAYRKLEQFDESRPLAPWLFRIAHNRCIDLLRRRSVRQGAEAEAAGPASVTPAEPLGPELGRAVEHLVLALPPKERASVLLKDVFDYRLEEIAELVGSTVGGVKAALHRGRSKLASLPRPTRSRPPASPEMSRLLRVYVDRFHRRDWDGLRELIRSDARLHVADRYSGPLAESPYFANYERAKFPWRLDLGEVDGESVILVLQPEDGAWQPRSAVRIEVSDGAIERIVDYLHCPWVLSGAASVSSFARQS